MKSASMSAPSFKAAARLKRLMSALDITNATRHGQRTGRIAHVDRSRTHLNRHWAYAGGQLVEVGAAPDLAPLIERRRQDRGAVVRKNTPTIASEMLFIATREAFLNDAGEIDAERAYAWADEMLHHFEAMYPGMTCAARLDLDERTPHFSVFAVPIYMKGANRPRSGISEAGRATRQERAPKATVSHKQVFGSIEDMRALQRWTQGINATFFARYGLTLTPSTPRSESGARHIPPEDFRRLMQDAGRIADELADEARAEADQTRASAETTAARIIEKAAARAAEIVTAAEETATEARDELASARSAAREAAHAALEARTEASEVLAAVRAAAPLRPLHEAYTALLDGSSMTAAQALAAEEAARADLVPLNQITRKDGFLGAEDSRRFTSKDVEAAIMLAHPEVKSAFLDLAGDDQCRDLAEPANGGLRFRARFLNIFGKVRELVEAALEAVIERRIETIRKGFAGTHVNDLYAAIPPENAWERYDERNAAIRTLSRFQNPRGAARKDVEGEAVEHARDDARTAARLARGPRAVQQWLQIPRALQSTFEASFAAAERLEAALARRLAPKGTAEPQQGPAVLSAPRTPPPRS